MKGLLLHPGYLIWILLAYLPFLGGVSVPLTGDQKVYLSTAMEMRERGSHLIPLLFGQSSYFKPPWQYWASIVGWSIFGFNFWGALVPSVVALVATAWFLGEIGVILGPKRAYLNAPLWFAAALGTITYGTTGQMEIWLVFFYAAAWWAGLRFLAPPFEERSWGWLYLAFALAGISALVKSPLYSVFLVAGYLSFLVVSGEWELFREKRLYLAWALGVVLGSIWYIYVIAVDRDRFWSHYVLQETWGKKAGNNSSFLSIWGALLYFCFPFTLLVVPGLRTILKGRRTGPVLRWIVCWSWAPAIFFSLYPYRIKPYLYILVPALALAVDWSYARLARRGRLFRGCLYASGVLVAWVLLVLAGVIARAELAPLPVAIGFALTAVLFFTLAFRQQMRALALTALLAVFLFRATAVSIGEQDIAGLKRFVAEHPGHEIVMLDEHHNIWHEIGYLSLGIGMPMHRVYDADEAAAALSSGHVLLLSDGQEQEFLPEIREKLGAAPLARVDWPRWKVRGKFPFRALILKGRAGVPDFDERTHRHFGIYFAAEP
jgi:hypothetical protein